MYTFALTVYNFHFGVKY